jgi:hypothetical protein
MAGGLFAQVQSTLRVIRESSPQLTPADLTTIEQVVAAAGKPAWFIAYRGNGRTTRGEQAWTAGVFLTADVANSQVRRGRAVELNSPVRGPRPDPVLWSIDSRQQPTRRWAQVAVPGRAFDDVRNREDDENQPFMVLADIPDEDLIGVVTYVRSQQSFARAAASGEQPSAYGPVSYVGYSLNPKDPPSSIRVGMHVPSSPGTSAMLLVERRGNEWTGTFTGFGYSDSAR